MNFRKFLLATYLLFIPFIHTMGQSETSAIHHIRPSWSFDGKLIAYLSDNSGTYQLYVTPIDPIKAVNITPASDNIIQFKWSPTENKLIYVTGDALFMVNADGTQQKQITSFHEPPFFFNWNPTGNTIYFNCQYREDMKTLCEYRLSVGKERKLIDETWNIRNFSLSPDGKILAFDANQGANLDIYYYEFLTRKIKKIADLPFHAIDPVFAIHSNQMVFISDQDGRNQNFDVFITDASGNEIKLLTTFNGYNLPIWFPGDKELLINTNQSGEWEIYKIKVDGTDLKQIGNGIGFSISPANNEILVQIINNENYKISLMDKDGHIKSLSDEL